MLFWPIGLVVALVTMLASFALVSVLGDLGIPDENLNAIPYVGVGVAGVLSIVVLVVIYRRLPPAIRTAVDQEDDVVEDSTPAIFGVSDPDADSATLAARVAGADAGVAPPADDPQLTGPR